MGVAIGLGVAALASGIAGGVMQSQAQQDASDANRANIRDTNALNYQMFRQARGAGGSAILPLYADPGTEAALLNRSVATYDAVTGEPVNMQLSDYQALAQQMQPAIQGGNVLVNGIYNGQLQGQRLANANPVLAARTNLANSNAGAIDLGLSQSQNAIAAQDAAKGYVGGGSFVNNRLAQALVGARQQAAQVRGQANLDNAQDVRNVKDQVINTQLASLDMPFNRTASLLQNAQAPYTAAANRQNLGLSALNFFKLNPGSPPSAMPYQQPVIPSGGAVAASGVSQGLGSAMNAYQQQQLINALGSQSSSNYPSYNPNYFTPEDQAVINQYHLAVP